MVFNATFNNISFVKFITTEMCMYIYLRWLVLREWIFQSNLASKANPVMRDDMRSPFRAKHINDGMLIEDLAT